MLGHRAGQPAPRRRGAGRPPRRRAAPTPSDAQHEQRPTPGRRAAAAAAAYPVSRRRPGAGVRGRPQGRWRWSRGHSRRSVGRSGSGAGTTVGHGSVTPLTRAAAGSRGWRSSEPRPVPGALDDRPRPLTALPRRAARWSAMHPWRAIRAWLALVAVAVGLAVTRADRRDQRCRLPASASPGGPRPCSRDARPRPARHRARPGHRRAGDLDSADAEPRPPPARRRSWARLAGVDGRGASRSGTRTARALLVVGPAGPRRRVDAAHLARGDGPTWRAAHPALPVRESGDLTLDDGDQRRAWARTSAAAEGISLPITLVLMLLAFGALVAAGIPVLLAVTSVAATIGHHGAGLPPGPRRGDRDQHDRADRHGGRGRLLAVLPQAGARGAGRGPHARSTPSRSPPRPPATRSWSPAVP